MSDEFDWGERRARALTLLSSRTSYDAAFVGKIEQEFYDKALREGHCFEYARLVRSVLRRRPTPQEFYETIYHPRTASDKTFFSKLVTCGKCKQNRVTYFEKQVRSADESMTCFYHCTNCDHRWKS